MSDRHQPQHPSASTMQQDANRIRALRAFAEKIAVPLHDPSWLDRALTHSSSLPEGLATSGKDFESLEFLGDAVLELAISHRLFELIPDKTPGEYTRLRASVVSRVNVARIASELSLSSMIILGKGEEQSGGRKRNSLQGDCLEAVIGAVYLDAGWEAARDFVFRIFSSDLAALQRSPHCWDYKSLLQIYCQKSHIALPLFKVVNCSGPDHRKHFVVAVYVRDKLQGRGSGWSKKEAEQDAARKALLILEKPES